MLTLGVRLWTGKNMIYPSKFSVLTDFSNHQSSMRTYLKNEKIDTKSYMILTPGMAINGEIYEMDIICNCSDEKIIGVVEFDPTYGAFIIKVNDEVTYITNNMDSYEIIGNIYEDWDEFREMIPNSEKFEEILNQKKETKLLNKKDLESNIIKNNDGHLEETIINEEKESEKSLEIVEELPVIEENNLEETLSDEFLEEEIPQFDIFSENIEIEEPVEPEIFDFQDEEVETDIKVYVDGQVLNDMGAYSYIMQYGTFERIDNGKESNTTKNRMELKAVIEALKALNSRCNIKIYTTSQYLIVPFIRGWIFRWKANDWKKESNEEVKNKDLWEELYNIHSNHNVEWEFIKPGSSIVEVLRCIDLSKEALNK